MHLHMVYTLNMVMEKRVLERIYKAHRDKKMAMARGDHLLSMLEEDERA